MQTLQEHEVRKLVKAYQDRAITIEELREEIEWYWDRRIHKGARIPLLTRRWGRDLARQVDLMAQRNP